MTGTAIEFCGVWKRFDADWVLQDVNLALPDQATSAVVGESGSGKSTLLQLINAVYRADRGTVKVFDRKIPDEDVYRWRRAIGYSVQGAGLFPHLTVFENVTLLARLSGVERELIETRYRSLLDIMGLSRELDGRFPHLLSGGQQQRVGLCRALMLQPKLLLLDEPFSALDSITRTGLYDVFKRLRDLESVTTVLVTHDVGEAVQLADHLVVLKDGVVQQSEPVAAVLQRPANDYVRTLFANRSS
jgi:osmoprotectant transport system ATP-binding protein